MSHESHGLGGGSLTGLVLGHVEEGPDVERSVSLVVQVESRLVVSIGNVAIELLMHVLCDVAGLLHPQGVEHIHTGR